LLAERNQVRIVEEGSREVMKQALLAVSICVGMSFSAVAQEYGRGSLDSGADGKDSGLGHSALPKSSYGGAFLSGAWGLKLGIGWANVDWSFGDLDGSETTFYPSGSVFYRANDYVDINLSGLFLSVEEDVGDITADGELTRVAVGARCWPVRHSRIAPYLGVGVGYYMTDVDLSGANRPGDSQPSSATMDIDDVPGACIEGGVAWQITDNFFINTDLTYDLLLSSPSASVGNVEDDFDVDVLAVNVGATWMF
jgi:hypothetical protein